MIFNGKELKAAVHEAAGIKNARIAYDAESRCVIISGDSLRIEKMCIRDRFQASVD